MPKKYFWPAALIVMGFVLLASNLGLLPGEFWNFWPLILIVVGLGGLLTADRDEWMVEPGERGSKKSPKSRSRK